jgi:LacI family transcriptional regulator
MCVNDSSARAVINHLKSMGMKIPGEISVTGFDDVELSKYMSPPLTTVRQEFFEMGSIAAKILLESIESKDLGYRQILLPTEIVIRESTGPVNSGSTNK